MRDVALLRERGEHQRAGQPARHCVADLLAIIAARHAQTLALAAFEEQANPAQRQREGEAGEGIDFGAEPIPQLVALAAQPTTQFMLQPPKR